MRTLYACNADRDNMTVGAWPVDAEEQQELKTECTLPQLRLCQVDGAISQTRDGLKRLRQRHVSNENRRQDALVRERNRELRREAKQERIRQRHKYATKIQALVRRYFVRRFVLPVCLEEKAAAELETSRVALTETMLSLHQNIHDLSHLEEDRRQAATRLQAWWRGLLARRVVAIVRIRRHLAAVHVHLAEAATRISSMARGRQARMGCFHLRMEREERKLQAQRVASDRKLKAVIKIQSHVRRRAAALHTQARKAQMSRELDGDRGDGGVPLDSRDRVEPNRKSPQAAGGRRKRNAETHGGSGNSGARRVHHEQASQAGALLVADADAELRRKSYGAHGHKAKKSPTRKTQAAGDIKMT